MEKLTKEELEEYAFFFKSMRHSTGYSLRAMADKLHISSETLRNWERGKSIPRGSLNDIVYEVREVVKDYHRNNRLAG